MKWITWENVGVDRIGCSWLIQRFIDPEAQFRFIPVGHTPIPEDYEPFDIPGVRLTHRHGHCTFHTMLQEYHLNDPILQRIAQIIDEADVVQSVTIEPIASGLDFLCQGVRLVSADDQSAIESGRLLYEALYARLKAE